MSKGVYEKRLEKDLESVRKRIRRMGKAVVSAVRDATRAVLVSDEALATDTILGDLPINRQALDLDERCHLFIARHLPSAGHLRFISAAMRLSKTLERIGDYAETIARAALHITKRPPESILQDIEVLGAHAASVLEDALEAFDKERIVEARAMRQVVNRYASTYDRMFDDLIAAGRQGDYPVEDLFAIAAISHRLERIIHQAKNISEQTLFAVAGERKEAKTFDFLIADRSGSGASLLATEYCRKAFPEAGTFRCASWQVPDEPDDRFITFADSKGIDLSLTIPVHFRTIKEHVDEYDLIIDLESDGGGGVNENIRKVPFHTTILRWPLKSPGDPEAVHKELVHRLGDLMDTLRGEDDS